MANVREFEQFASIEAAESFYIFQREARVAAEEIGKCNAFIVLFFSLVLHIPVLQAENDLQVLRKRERFVYPNSPDSSSSFLLFFALT